MNRYFIVFHVATVSKTIAFGQSPIRGYGNAYYISENDQYVSAEKYNKMVLASPTYNSSPFDMINITNVVEVTKEDLEEFTGLKF